MKRLNVSGIFLVGLFVFATPVFAENVSASDIFGKWVAEFPTARAMVVEFTGNSMSVYEVSASGIPVQPRSDVAATYRVLGKTIVITLQDGREITALMKSRDALILDVDGHATYPLFRAIKHPI